MCSFHYILSLAAELSPLELVNFSKSLLSRALLLKFTHNVCVYMKLCICNFHVCPSVCPWTQFCPELPLLNHSPFCDQNLLYDNGLVGGMITFSDGSSLSWTTSVILASGGIQALMGLYPFPKQ